MSILDVPSRFRLARAVRRSDSRPSRSFPSPRIVREVTRAPNRRPRRAVASGRRAGSDSTDSRRMGEDDRIGRADGAADRVAREATAAGREKYARRPSGDESARRASTSTTKGRLVRSIGIGIRLRRCERARRCRTPRESETPVTTWNRRNPSFGRTARAEGIP